MKYAVADLPAMLLTPLGRILILRGVRYQTWFIYALMARWYRRTVVRRTRIATIVGSYGKSTTARAISSAMGDRMQSKVEGNAWTNVARAILEIYPGERHRTIEIGISGPGQMHLYPNIVCPDVVVVTSIGSEHNRSFGDLMCTRQEKAEMLRSLPSSATVVLNADDKNVMWMATQTRARVVTFGMGAGHDVYATHVTFDWPRGTRLRLNCDEEKFDLRIRLLGPPGVYAALAAAAVARVDGRSWSAAVRGLETLLPTPGRLEIVPLEGDAYLLQDDFKSSLETVHSALDVLETIPAPRKTIVMGGISEPPGSQGAIYREVGSRMADIADRVIVLGHNNFKRYVSGARAAGHDIGSFTDVGHDLRAACDQVRHGLQEREVVLVKGRGTQHLDRIGLMLRGQTVACDIRVCDAGLRCEICPMRQIGWGRHRVIT